MISKMAVTHTDSAKENSLISKTVRFQGHVQKWLQECLISTAVLSLDPSPLTIPASSVTKTPGNTEEDPHDPEPVAEQDSKNTPLISCAPLNIGTVTKSTCKNVRQYRYHLIIQHIR